MTMNEYQTPAMQQLETAFTFQSVSGKNSGFLASTRGQDFAFGSYPCGAPELLFIHAAGHISYTVPVRYTLAPTSYLIVMLTVRGNAVLRCPNGDISLARHDFLLFPPGFTLQFATGETPFSYYLCFVSGVLAEQYLPPLLAESPFLHQQLSPASDIALSLFPSMAPLLRAPDTDTALHVNAVFHTILSDAAYSASAKARTEKLPPHVRTVRQIYEQDYKNPHSLDALSAETGVSKYKLCRDFSASLGISPLQYLNRVRIEEAKRLLASSNDTVHEIGSLVGIDNTNHFIRLFKKSTGITPLQFRQISAERRPGLP